MIIIEVDVATECNITEALTDALRLSKLLQVGIDFDYNGINSLVLPTDNVETLVKLWSDRMNKS